MTDEGFFSRTALVYGDGARDVLGESRVIVFGVGGVGGYVCEALARTGVGHIELVDSDRVNESNLNRQIVALRSNIGRKKTEIMRERILDINPSAQVVAHDCFFLGEEGQFDFSHYDYVADCIDTVSAKVALIKLAQKAGTPVISAMGCAGKTDPSRLKITDIYKTNTDPLAKNMRLLLRRAGIKKCRVVFSDEVPVTREKRSTETAAGGEKRVRVIGSSIFVPASAGLLIGANIVKELLKKDE